MTLHTVVNLIHESSQVRRHKFLLIVPLAIKFQTKITAISKLIGRRIMFGSDRSLKVEEM